MCGRYTLAAELDELRDRFSFDEGPIEYRPRYNIAPTQEVLTVIVCKVSEFGTLRGLK